MSWQDFRGLDLRERDLRGLDLRHTDFTGADLRGTDLRGSDLRWSTVTRGQLRGALLEGADLRCCTPPRPSRREPANTHRKDRPGMSITTTPRATVPLDTIRCDVPGCRIIHSQAPGGPVSPAQRWHQLGGVLLYDGRHACSPTHARALQAVTP